MATENLTLSGEDRLLALEMAQELRERDERLCALAAAIEGKLTPRDGGNSPDFGAWRLSEILSELLSDTEQQWRLIKLLDPQTTA